MVCGKTRDEGLSDKICGTEPCEGLWGGGVYGEGGVMKEICRKEVRDRLLGVETVTVASEACY
jgi:hypothetical protein